MTESDPPPGVLNRFLSQGDTSLRGRASDELALELLRRVRADEMPDLVLAGLLGIELDRHANRHLNRYSAQYLSDLFHRLAVFPGRPTDIRGTTFVNLGCGSHHPLGLPMVFLMLGAQRAISVDLDPPQEVAAGLFAIARTAAAMLLDPKSLVGDLAVDRQAILANLAGFDFRKLLAGDASGIPANRLQFRLESVYGLEMADASADFVVSNSLLEHLGDIETAVSEMSRITKVGGFGSHAIDGVDHRSYCDATLHPLDFLRERSSASLVHGSNRIRPLDFPQIFQRHGFEVVDCMPYGELAVTEAQRAGFSEPFRSMTMRHLIYGSARIVVRRV